MLAGILDGVWPFLAFGAGVAVVIQGRWAVMRRTRRRERRERAKRVMVEATGGRCDATMAKFVGFPEMMDTPRSDPRCASCGRPWSEHV